jgi:hypothetical protein
VFDVWFSDNLEQKIEGKGRVMKKNELRDLVFEQFQLRREALLKKRTRFQEELTQELHQLREAYGREVMNGLGELVLTLGGPSQAQSSDSVSPVRATKGRRRHRRQRVTGKENISGILRECVPAAVTSLAGLPEFTTGDVHRILQERGVTVDKSSVSLFLPRHAKELGLTVEKRGVGLPARPTNFFRQSGKGKVTTARPGKAKPGQRIEWKDIIVSALTGARLSFLDLKGKLIQQGIPKEKFNGPAFRDALKRLVKTKKVHFGTDAYFA